jgi:hypothetical protein
MYTYYVFVLFCVYVYVSTLRRADPPSKESYRLHFWFLGILFNPKGGDNLSPPERLSYIICLK